MKRFSLLLTSFIVLQLTNTDAQTFKVALDTVPSTVVKTLTSSDNVKNTTDSNLTLKWHVTGTDFPADWLTGPAFGICDNYSCIGNIANTLWDAVTSVGGIQTSTYYHNITHDSLGAFALSLDLSNASTIGKHWVSVNISHPATAYSKNITFVVTKQANGVPGVVAGSGGYDLVMFPNPAVNTVTLSSTTKITGATQVTITNTFGQVVFAKTFAANGTHFSVDIKLDKLGNGFYIVHVSGDGLSATRRLVVSR